MRIEKLNDDITLYCGDSFEISSTIPFANVCISDPPYKVAAGFGGGVFGARDSLVNTGGFTDNGVDYSFLDRFENWVCFCSKKQLKTLIEKAEAKEHWNLLTWNKTNPLPTINNKYLPDVEYIIHAWKSGNLYGDYHLKSTFMVLPTGGGGTQAIRMKSQYALWRNLFCCRQKRAIPFSTPSWVVVQQA